MPATEVLVYKDDLGEVPFALWLAALETSNQAAAKKCIALVTLLEEFGHELRRPRADYLRDGVYELRTEVRNVNFRILYGFVGQQVALLSHGLTKTGKVPAKEIELAIARLKEFAENPKQHTARLEDLK